MRRALALLLLFSLRIAAAQTPAEPPAQSTPQPPLLSPQAAYDQASAPVDITRRDLANWSDTEVNVAHRRHRAGQRCLPRPCRGGLHRR